MSWSFTIFSVLLLLIVIAQERAIRRNDREIARNEAEIEALTKRIEEYP